MIGSDYMQNFSTMQTVEPRDDVQMVPREAVQAPSLEVLGAQVNIYH